MPPASGGEHPADGPAAPESDFSREDLASTLNAVSDAIAVQRPDGAIIWANAAAARLLGYDSPDELLAAPLSALTERFELLDETGKPLPPEMLPGRLATRCGRCQATTQVLLSCFEQSTRLCRPASRWTVLQPGLRRLRALAEWGSGNRSRGRTSEADGNPGIGCGGNLWRDRFPARRLLPVGPDRAGHPVGSRRLISAGDDGCVGEGGTWESVLHTALSSTSAGSAAEIAALVEKVALGVQPDHPDDIAALVARFAGPN